MFSKLSGPLAKLTGRMIVPVIIQTKKDDAPIIKDLLDDYGLERRVLNFGMVATVLPTELFTTLDKMEEILRVYKDYPVSIPEATAGEGFELFRGGSFLGNLLKTRSLAQTLRTMRDTVSEKKQSWVGTKESGDYLGIQEALEVGIDGNGIKIGIVDTDSSIRFQRHPQLSGRVIGHAVNLGMMSSDTNGHGGHVATTAMGSQGTSPLGLEVRGIAPLASGVGVKVLFTPAGTGSASSVIEGINYALEQKCDVINLSLGSNPEGNISDDPIVQAIEQVPQNVVVCCASGNDGPGTGSVDTPGISKSALTVGAFDTRLGKIADFSSRGPTPGGVVKPDFIMPGVNIYSGITPRTIMDRIGDLISEGYGPLSGTSMATPHMAGMVALIKDFYMEDYGIQVTADVVRNIGARYGHSKNNIDGYGLLTWEMVKKYGASFRGSKQAEQPWRGDETPVPAPD